MSSDHHISTRDNNNTNRSIPRGGYRGDGRLTFAAVVVDADAVDQTSNHRTPGNKLLGILLNNGRHPRAHIRRLHRPRPKRVFSALARVSHIGSNPKPLLKPITWPTRMPSTDIQ